MRALLLAARCRVSGSGDVGRNGFVDKATGQLHCFLMITSKVTRRGQTTLPRRVRDALKVKPGQSLVYEVEGDRVVLHAHPGVLASFGALKKKKGGRPADFKKARAAARREWADHAGQEGAGG